MKYFALYYNDELVDMIIANIRTNNISSIDCKEHIVRIDLTNEERTLDTERLRREMTAASRHIMPEVTLDVYCPRILRKMGFFTTTSDIASMTSDGTCVLSDNNKTMIITNGTVVELTNIPYGIERLGLVHCDTMVTVDCCNVQHVGIVNCQSIDRIFTPSLLASCTINNCSSLQHAGLQASSVLIRNCSALIHVHVLERDRHARSCKVIGCDNVYRIITTAKRISVQSCNSLREVVWKSSEGRVDTRTIDDIEIIDCPLLKEVTCVHDTTMMLCLTPGSNRLP